MYMQKLLQYRHDDVRRDELSGIEDFPGFPSPIRAALGKSPQRCPGLEKSEIVALEDATRLRPLAASLDAGQEDIHNKKIDITRTPEGISRILYIDTHLSGIPITRNLERGMRGSRSRRRDIARRAPFLLHRIGFTGVRLDAPG